MTTGSDSRRTGRVRTPAAKIEVSQREHRAQYKVLEFSGHGAVIQGPTLDASADVEVHVTQPHSHPVTLRAQVKRQVPILGRALIEVVFGDPAGSH